MNKYIESQRKKWLQVIKEELEKIPKQTDKCYVICRPVGVIASKMCDELKLSNHTKEYCVEIVHQIMQNDNARHYVQSRSRLILAAAIVYTSAIQNGERRTVPVVCYAAGTSSRNAVAKAFRKIAELLEIKMEG